MDHLTTEQIERYQAGDLGNVQDYRVADAHIATCAYCQERLFHPARESVTAMTQTLAQLLEGLPQPYSHPPQDVLADTAQNEASSPPAVAEHLRACAQCRDDVADLRGYLQGLEAARSADPRVASPMHWPRLSKMFRSHFLYGGALAFAAVVILFFLVKSRPIVTINDAGGQWTLDGWGRVNGPAVLPTSLQTSLARALRDRKLETPAVLASLQGQYDTLLRPARMVVLSDRPTLEWKPPSDATAQTEYVCTIVSISNPSFKRPPSKPVKKPSWTLPPAKPALPRGEIYTWRVVARTNGKFTELTGPPNTLPKFKVLEQARVAALEDAGRAYGRSHLTMALLYTQEGLLDEAQREFAALQQANPGSRDIEALQAGLDALRHAAS